MNQSDAIISGLVELALSFGLGLLVTIGGFRLFSKLSRDLDEAKELRENNVAVGIVLASMVVSCALVVRAAVFPVISTLQTELGSGIDASDVARLIGWALLFVLFAGAGAVGAMVVGVRIFMRLTPEIDELAELRRNNVAVAIALAGFLLVMALFLSSGVESFLSALMPQPLAAPIEIFGLGR